MSPPEDRFNQHRGADLPEPGQAGSDAGRLSVAVLSTTKLPRFLGPEHPNEKSLFAEDDRLTEALGEAGFSARRIPWREPGVAWEEFDVALIRSTWDYIDHLPEFLETLGDIEARGVRLINPLETVRWNHNKRYLRDLAGLGVRVVPTMFLDSADAEPRLPEDWPTDQSDFVTKPIVGVGSFDVRVIRGRDALDRELARKDRPETVIVQPFVPSILSEGEWSFVFAAGEFLYALLKKPAPGDFRVQVIYGAVMEETEPARADLAVARRAYELMPVPAHIARIDMVRLDDGLLAVMEAELIEPQLHLFDVPSAPDKIARAVRRLVAG